MNPPEKKGLRTALLLLFAGTVLRCPPILLHGRMWGEELTVFLAQGWNRPVSTALFAPHFGYFSVWDNCAAAFAIHCLPLAWMALFFTWSSVFILLLTGYFVYTAEFLTTPTARLLGVLALIFCTPSVETWINLLNSEFFFGILGAVILLSNADRLPVQRHLALCLAVLSGPLTTLLAPLYLLRAVIGRQRNQITQAILVCTGGILQIAIAHFTAVQGRQMRPSLINDGAILFNKDFIQLFFSRIAAKETYLLLHLHFSTVVLIAFWMLLVLATAFLARVLRGQRPALLLLAVALWYAFIEFSLSTEGGLRFVDPTFQERYGFIPNFLIELGLIVAAVSILRTRQRTAARVLLTLAFLSGAVDYLILPFHEQLDWRSEPWRIQVLRWQNDPTQTLQGFPTAWAPIHLPPKSSD